MPDQRTDPTWQRDTWTATWSWDSGWNDRDPIERRGIRITIKARQAEGRELDHCRRETEFFRWELHAAASRLFPFTMTTFGCPSSLDAGKTQAADAADQVADIRRLYSLIPRPV